MAIRPPDKITPLTPPMKSEHLSELGRDQMTKNHSLASSVEVFIQNKTSATESVLDAITAVRKDRDLTDEERNDLLAKLVLAIGAKDVRQEIVQLIPELSIGASFRASLVLQSLWQSKLEAEGLSIGRRDNPKHRDRTFATSLGLPIPKVLQDRVTFESLQMQPGTIVKPEEGSTSIGVYLVEADESLRSVSSGRQYPSLEKALYSETGTPERLLDGRWISEKAIMHDEGDLAHDFKIFTFYGRPALIQEIRRNVFTPTPPEHCFYNPEGEIIDTGSPNPSFRGAGFNANLLLMAKDVSINTPLPFVRVDFLDNYETAALGEITPLPGGVYLGRFSPQLDFSLGLEYVEAQARLFKDMFEGKQFTKYTRSYH